MIFGAVLSVGRASDRCEKPNSIAAQDAGT
jgi:hypothetical protein